MTTNIVDHEFNSRLFNVNVKGGNNKFLMPSFIAMIYKGAPSEAQICNPRVLTLKFRRVIR